MIFPGLALGRSIEELMTEIGRQFDAALKSGFRVVKMEVLFYDLVTDRELVALIERDRKMFGDSITMAVDFGYRWHNWHAALFVLERIGEFDICFAEATLQHDDLECHARLAERSSIRMRGADAAATPWEVREWLTRGKVGVGQPNIGRAGGLTEIRRIADLYERYCLLRFLMINISSRRQATEFTRGRLTIASIEEATRPTPSDLTSAHHVVLKMAEVYRSGT